MAVASVHQFQIKPGRLQDALSLIAEVRKIHERLGGRVRVWQTTIGGQPNAGAYVIEHDDLNAYGAFSTKLQSDSAWQAIEQRIAGNADLPTEVIQSSLVTEIV